MNWEGRATVSCRKMVFLWLYLWTSLQVGDICTWKSASLSFTNTVFHRLNISVLYILVFVCVVLFVSWMFGQKISESNNLWQHVRNILMFLCVFLTKEKVFKDRNLGSVPPISVRPLSFSTLPFILQNVSLRIGILAFIMRHWICLQLFYTFKSFHQTEPSLGPNMDTSSCICVLVCYVGRYGW